MSGSIVSVDVTPVQPVQVIEVEADGTHIDVVPPPAPTVEVDLPDQQPVSVDVTAAPPVVVVDTPAPLPPPSIDVEMPDPVTVDVIATPPTPVRVDAIAAWQSGIQPDAPADGNIYGRLNNGWVGALGLLTGYAPLNSPNFSGVPTAPTPSQGVSTDQLATTAYVRSAVLGHPDLVTSVAAKIGDVLIYTGDIEDWDGKVLDGGNF